MKRFGAISLLFLLLYNAFGYYALFAFEWSQAKKIARAEYPNQNCKIIKIPISAYVHLEDTDFEDAEGQFETPEGTFNIIKTRRVNDTLQIYALHNERQDRISTQFNDYMKDLVSIHHEPLQKKPGTGILKNLFKNYIPEHPLAICTDSPMRHLPSQVRIMNDALFPADCIMPHAPPPRSFA